MDRLAVWEEKKRMRDRIKREIDKLPEGYTEMASKNLPEQIEKIPAFHRAAMVFCFVGTKGELDTRRLIAWMWEQGKRIAAPKCIQKGIMEAREITSFLELEQGKYGILEPKEDCSIVLPEEIEFGILPCMTCNLEGWRLGYGGGYYDRYLEGAAFETAALCRERLLTKDIPVETHDRRVAYVATEARCVCCKTRESL